MIYTKNQIYDLVISMVATCAEKPATDKNVVACADAIVDLLYQNFEAGLDEAFAKTIKHFGLDGVKNVSA